jgi:hypothetical protein
MKKAEQKKIRDTKNAEINNVVYMKLYLGYKDGERKILENEKCEIEKSRVHCIETLLVDLRLLLLLLLLSRARPHYCPGMHCSLRLIVQP